MGGYNKETRVTRLFIGRGDFSAQDEHAVRCDTDGWYVAEDVQDPRYHEATRDVQGAIVVIHGADAGACVPFAAAHVLAKGAKRAVVPLTQIMTNNERGNPLAVRARKFLAMFRSFQKNEGDIDKLTVTPTKIWRKVRSAK